MRPESYDYLGIIRNHLNNDLNKIFNGELIYPRQMEVHLPGDGIKTCNFDCYYCQGRILKRPLGNWEKDGLKIIEQLKGAIPFYIYGGAYTEPLMNKYLLDYLKLTKKYKNSFGIHTNGSLLSDCEKKNGLCSWIIKNGDSVGDYISISLDAGRKESHCRTKNIKKDWFTEILKGIKILTELRNSKREPAIRICYLLNEFNSSPEEISEIVEIMKKIGVDTLRFSIPYDLYGKKFDEVKKYKKKFENKFGNICRNTILPFLSDSHNEKPYIFWHSPEYQDVEKMNYSKCIYSYYQITLGADGNVYKCSSSASPTFIHSILGKIPDNLIEFNKMVAANNNSEWDAGICFSSGARCNRIALEINDAWNKGKL